MKMTKVTAFLTILTVALGSTQLQSGGGAGWGVAGGLIGASIITNAAANNNNNRQSDYNSAQIQNLAQNQQQLNDKVDAQTRIMEKQKRMIRKLKKQLKKAGVKTTDDDDDDDDSDYDE